MTAARESTLVELEDLPRCRRFIGRQARFARRLRSARSLVEIKAKPSYHYPIQPEGCTAQPTSLATRLREVKGPEFPRDRDAFEEERLPLPVFTNDDALAGPKPTRL